MWPKSVQFRVLFCLLWLTAAVTGFSFLVQYQTTQGTVGHTPSQWPGNTPIVLNHSRNTLLMFVHPQCPCSRASIEELNRVAGKTGSNVDVRVYFFRPRSEPSEWVKSDLWRSAAAIPGVSVFEDIDGEQAQIFGAETSGYVLLYDTHAQLLFRGGITESRGHIGENAAEDSLVLLTLGQNSPLIKTPVFGCSLLSQCTTLTNTVNTVQ